MADYRGCWFGITLYLLVCRREPEPLKTGRMEDGMKRLTDGIYIHKGKWIVKDEQGICVEGHLEIFKTWNDAREFINKFIDGTNKIEPRIIGEWTCN